MSSGHPKHLLFCPFLCAFSHPLKQIVQVVRDSLKENTRLAVFDHISSVTAVLFPIRKLVELCHSRCVCVRASVCALARVFTLAFLNPH